MDEDPRGKTTFPADFTSRFLKNRDDTGRFIVVSKRTGRKYFVEAIGKPRIEWGSIDPSNPDKLMTKKGWCKNEGSIDARDSMITKENGFSKIHDLKPGISPHAYIDMLDAQYPTIEQA